MDEYLKIEMIDGKLSIKLLKEITAQDFAAVAKSDEEGVAISFIEALTNDSWTFTRGDITHTGYLRIAFCYAPQVKAKLNDLVTFSKVDQYTIVYLMDLFRVYEEVLEVPVKGKTEKAKDKAFEEMKSLSATKEQELYERAAAQFNKAVLMLQSM